MSEAYLDYYRGKKVLVTGGLGFIGINTCLRLLNLGAEVTALDNFVPPDLAGRLTWSPPGCASLLPISGTRRNWSGWCWIRR